MRSHLKSCVFASLLFSSCLLIVNTVYAQNYSGESFPKDFKYQNKPIDPLCIDKLSLDQTARASSVNVDECSKHRNIVEEGVNDDLIRKGYIGYEYSYNLPGATEKGTTYYKYLGKVDDAHVIYAMQNTGGSGFFTSILWIKRQGNNLRLLKEIAGGNRCNGGIDPSITLKDKKVTYKASVTPFGVMAMSGVMQPNIQSIDDLTDCAVCCVGDATFEYDLSKDNAVPMLLSLSFAKDAGRDEIYTQGKLQNCFNEQVRDYIKKNKNAKFTQDQLKTWAEQFNTTCVK